MKTASGTAVARALRRAASQVEKTVGLVNRRAASLVAKGDYATAEPLVVLARSARDFRREIEGILDRWNGLFVSSRKPRADATPLWEYYRPALRLLVGMGGKASARDFERQFESQCAPSLKPGDQLPNRSGVPRWRRNLDRARRAMVKEGFLEPDNRKSWRITEAGAKAAAT